MANPAINSKYENRTHLEQLVWNMRLADLPRGETRAILNRMYNGEAPFPEDTAEENNIQINRNDLTGVNMLTQARRQWTQAMLKPGNFFTVQFDSGDKNKRREWGHTVTKHANNVLRTSRDYIEQSRASGGTMLLHGMGPTVWKNRRSVVPMPIDIASVLIPTETTIDFDNLPHFSLFHEWTPHQLAKMVYGPSSDPGWNKNLVQAQWSYVRNQLIKAPNVTAFQYMPERIEELLKQDGAMYGYDAVPTIDVWDCYLRADDDSGGWYRRIFLDWGPTEGDYKRDTPPARKDGAPGDNQFLYTSGRRKFANHINEIVHFQLGDCSCVFPQRYHSIRSLGWMLWGICDLENRLHCKFSEALFEQLMWFFRTAGNADLIRLKKADFFHFGVIPQGIDWVKAQDRFTPDANIVGMGFARFQKLMADNASSFTNDFDAARGAKEMTATETMARVNSINALVSGLMTLAYTYEEFKDREVMRRLCIKGSRDPLAKKFQTLCIQDKVPSEMFDSDLMIISRERSLGAGNKTLEMAIIQFLQQIRKNLGPDAQRRIDHISIETATDDAALAEELAPVEGKPPTSQSTFFAELSTERLMKGLPFEEMSQMVYGDYVQQWLADLARMIGQDVENGNMAKPEDIAGYQNMSKHIQDFLEIMAQDEDERPKVRQYADLLKDLMNHVKAFEQRLIQQMQAASQNGNGENGQIAAETQAKIQADLILAKSKAKIGEQRSAQRMAMDQARFEQEQQNREREHHADIRRTGLEHYFEQIAGHQQHIADLIGELRRANLEAKLTEKQAETEAAAETSTTTE